VDLVLAEGATLALAGPSGSGKSTLARILARLEAPSSGRILLGGVDLLALPLAAARRAVLVLEQEPYVFSGSLAENLALGFGPGPDAPSRPRLEEAARRAGLGPLVAALERGLDGAVGEGGRILSGGERQRVAMARAFLSDPALLVLDEATSALDEDSEQLLLGEVDRWRDGRSLLVVAHRRSTLLRAAAVARMDGGRVRAPLPFDPSDTVARDSVHLDPAGERPSNDGTTERFQPSAESA
jgi:ATP-binding cassette subfamily B protein